MTVLKRQSLTDKVYGSPFAEDKSFAERLQT